MKWISKWSFLTASASMLFLASCGLPRSGPTERELLAATKQQNVILVEVTEDILRRFPQVNTLSGFPRSFYNVPPHAYKFIYPGDILTINIWENVDDGIFSSGVGASLPELQVDSQGFVFVPYAGRIKVSGKTVEAVRRIVFEKLEEQTPDPQVLVSRIAGDGASITISGNVGGTGVYPLERPTSTLSRAIAKAGGATENTEMIRVALFRGEQTGEIWLSDLLSGVQDDVALRPNDMVTLSVDDRKFTALGAFGVQSHIPFPQPDVSLSEAIGIVGGLNPQTGYPRSVFVLRTEKRKVLEVVRPENLSASSQVLYSFDLASSSGLFLSQAFQIRDGDILYASEAPFVQWQKVLSSITGSLGQVSRVTSLAK